MWADCQLHQFHAVSQNLSVLVLPVQRMVNAPIQWGHRWFHGVIRQEYLLKENLRLKAQSLLLRARLQRLSALERENAQLKALLNSTSRISGQLEVAQLLAVDLNRVAQALIIEKGKKDKVYPGEPVLDAYGVMGQVVDVGWLTSKVLLLTDPRLNIPVQNQRNGFRAITAGTGDSQRLWLLHVSDQEKVQIGDVFVTSGLGLHFPVGYPVGVVSSVKKMPGEPFLKVCLVPTAHFNRTQQVILVSPNQAALSKAIQNELKKSFNR